MVLLLKFLNSSFYEVNVFGDLNAARAYLGAFHVILTWPCAVRVIEYFKSGCNSLIPAVENKSCRLQYSRRSDELRVFFSNHGT